MSLFKGRNTTLGRIAVLAAHRHVRGDAVTFTDSGGTLRDETSVAVCTH
jgi:hypothetical protein